MVFLLIYGPKAIQIKTCYHSIIFWFTSPLFKHKCSVTGMVLPWVSKYHFQELYFNRPYYYNLLCL